MKTQDETREGPVTARTPKGTYMALPLNDGSSTITDQNEIKIFSMATDRNWESDRDYIVNSVNSRAEIVGLLRYAMDESKGYKGKLLAKEQFVKLCKKALVGL